MNIINILSSINDVKQLEQIYQELEASVSKSKEARSLASKPKLGDALLEEERTILVSTEQFQEEQKNYKRMTYKEYDFKNSSYKLPIALSEIIKCLKKSEKILSLPDNWDDNNNPSFSEKTWIGVVHFLTKYTSEIYDSYHQVIDIPKIYPSANGSIDIDWETKNYGILINVAAGGDRATYYADNLGTQMMEGAFSIKEFNINLLPKAIT